MTPRAGRAMPAPHGAQPPGPCHLSKLFFLAQLMPWSHNPRSVSPPWTSDSVGTCQHLIFPICEMGT